MSRPFPDWMTAVQARIETALAHRLPPADNIPARLHQAIRYSTLGGGKRVRPLLAYAAGEISGAPETRLEAVACAVEMIHVYSLVHDDLPCMDDDVLRRGRPTCHVEFDEATALLVGDALQAQAFEVLADVSHPDPSRTVEMMRLLAHASGSRGMAGGQAIDLEAAGRAGAGLRTDSRADSITLPELELMHALKTGALIRAAVLLGALCGDALPAGERDRLDHFAKRAGLLFQVIDDILDCTASTATLGKTAGKDQAQDKPTYVSVLGLPRARAFAVELHEETMKTLETFAERGQRLRELATFIAQRDF